MRVPDEANAGSLVAEIRRRIEFSVHIAPLVRGIERGMDDCEISH